MPVLNFNKFFEPPTTYCNKATDTYLKIRRIQLLLSLNSTKLYHKTYKHCNFRIKNVLQRLCLNKTIEKKFNYCNILIVGLVFVVRFNKVGLSLSQ